MDLYNSFSVVRIFTDLLIQYTLYLDTASSEQKTATVSSKMIILALSK